MWSYGRKSLTSELNPLYCRWLTNPSCAKSPRVGSGYLLPAALLSLSGMIPSPFIHLHFP